MINSTLSLRVLKDIFRIQKGMFSQQSQLLQKSNEFGNTYKNRRRDSNWLEEEQGFFSVFPQIEKEILDDQLIYHSYLPEVRESYKKLLNYTCPPEPLYYATAYTAIRTFKAFEKPSRITEENLKLVRILGWCLKLIEAAIIVQDDIVDNSLTRYNKPTWFNVVDINEAMMDSNFLECSSRYLALRHFSSHPQYMNISRELLKHYAVNCVSLKVDWGGKKYKLDDLETNKNLIKSYTFIVPPIELGMYLANVDDPYLHSFAKNFAIEIGSFMRAQDDFDCVFLPSLSKKDCTDVAQGRITWMGIQVIKNGTKAQKKTFEENYGKDDKGAIAQVYGVFEEMRMRDLFEQYQKDFYGRVHQMIEKMPKEMPKPLFHEILDFAVAKAYRS